MLRYCFLALASLVLLSTSSYAQTKKQTEKELKEELKRYRKMDPTQIKAMKDNLDRKTDDLKKAEGNYALVSSQLLETQTRLAASDSVAVAAKTENATLQTKINALQAENDADKEQINMMASRSISTKGKKGMLSTKGAPATGSYYAVQIGAFKAHSVNAKLMGSGIREDVQDGMKKYTVGQFFSRTDADSLKESLVEMGVKDAFVVSYKNGQRLQE